MEFVADRRRALYELFMRCGTMAIEVIAATAVSEKPTAKVGRVALTHQTNWLAAQGQVSVRGTCH